MVNYAKIAAQGFNDDVTLFDWEAFKVSVPADVFWSFNFIMTPGQVFELDRMDLEDALMGVGTGAYLQTNKVKLFRTFPGMSIPYAVFIPSYANTPIYPLNYKVLPLDGVIFPPTQGEWTLSKSKDLPKKGQDYMVVSRERSDGRVDMSAVMFGIKR